MKYHIDTIPVWDALKLEGECLLCALRRKQELLFAERFLGGSVMEPDIRIAVNESGFCLRHQALLHEKQNKLGHALMMHSHMKETHDRLQLLLGSVESAVQGKRRFVTRVLPHLNHTKTSLHDVALAIDKLISRCILCEDLDNVMERYTYTLLHLYKTDANFKKAFDTSKGVCLKDASALLKMAEKALSGKVLIDFVCSLSRLTHENLARVEGELEWFTLKADYRNADKPWGTSKDALERAVTRLRGWCIGAEPNPKDR